MKGLLRPRTSCPIQLCRVSRPSVCDTRSPSHLPVCHAYSAGGGFARRAYIGFEETYRLGMSNCLLNTTRRWNGPKTVPPG